MLTYSDAMCRRRLDWMLSIDTRGMASSEQRRIWEARRYLRRRLGLRAPRPPRRRRPVHFWNLRDPRPVWHCGWGAPRQGQEHRQSSEPRAVTCQHCLRKMARDRVQTSTGGGER